VDPRPPGRDPFGRDDIRTPDGNVERSHVRSHVLIDKSTTDAGLLSGILTYHVVPGRLSPGEVVGTHRTVNGATLEVTGSGDPQRVNGANVICGGVQTKNATIYLIDRVLLPPRGRLP
jgi:uncharacterized surface protein with fasciclin (FAS1) repeats